MLQVGFSRIDVTPPFGNDVSGYFVRRIADGTLDPLYANTIAVTSGEDTVILIATDYIGIRMSFADKIRKTIADRVGVPADHVLVAALHQHTSPRLDGDNSSLTYLRDTAFIDVVIRKLADSAQMAMDDRRDAVMSTALTEVSEPIAFVRRYFTDDGIVKSNPNTDKYNIVKRCAEADNSVRLVRFSREGANDIALVNFSTHPDVIGGTKWSADWPGFTRRFVEEDLDNVSCIFFTGTQGDSNHIDFFKPKSERKKGATGYDHSRYMGRTVANAVIGVWDKTVPMTDENVFAEHTVVYNITNTEGIEYYDDAVAYDKEYSEKATAGNWSSSLFPKHPYIQSIAHARRILSLRTAPIYLPVPLTVIGIGKVALVGFGGEAFTSYSYLLKESAPDKFLLTAVCANGYEGYFPTAEAFAQGGYEAISSLYTPELEQQILNAAKNMLNKF